MGADSAEGKTWNMELRLSMEVKASFLEIISAVILLQWVTKEFKSCEYSESDQQWF